MSSQRDYHSRSGTVPLPVPAPDDSDFLDSDDSHDIGNEHELTEMEAELAAVATPATSQATTTLTRRRRVMPAVPILQMTHNFSFTFFDSPAPSAEVLNRNHGREAAGLPVDGDSASSSTGSPSRHRQHQRRAEAQAPASEIAPHLAADATVHWFSVDNELVYLSFFDDWGPLNVAMFYRFCLHLHHLINSAQDDSVVSTDAENNNLHLILYTTSEPRTKANAALLAAMYAMVCGDASPADAYWPLSSLELLPFRDAGYGRADFYLTIQDILYGVHRAISEQLLDLMTFDLEEYETYEQVQNGDWNWITPNIIAFASPNDKEYVNELRERSQHPGRSTPGLRRPLNPTFAKTIQYFKERNVKLVVRLNNPLYDSRVFVREGIDHVDMYFDDGSNPSEDIVRDFIARADEVISSGGAIAVHCKAGLGRTGVLIGAYLAYKHGFSAGESIGFMRIMRPGCVVGPQQHFMYKEVTNWFRWSEQDAAKIQLEQALARQKQELIGKRRLSESNESSSNDTEVEVDMSLGEGEVRQIKKLRKTAQAPSTPKKAEDRGTGGEEGPAQTAKPTPCVGQPRKSPSPSRKRAAQAQAPATIARMGSGPLSLGRPRVVSSEDARSTSTSSSSSRQASSKHTRVLSPAVESKEEIILAPSREPHVPVERQHSQNAKVNIQRNASDDHVVATAVLSDEQQQPVGHNKPDVKMHSSSSSSSSKKADSFDDGLFVQGWKSPEPPSSYARRMSSSQSPSRVQAQAPGTPTSPGTPTHGGLRASPHVREMFGLRDSGSNQNTPQGHDAPRSRKELSAQSKSNGPSQALLQSSSSSSLTSRDAEGSDDNAIELQPGPIEQVRETDSRSNEKEKFAAPAVLSSPVKGKAPTAASRVPSARSQSRTASSSATASTQRKGSNGQSQGGNAAARKASGNAPRGDAPATSSPARAPSAAAGSAGRVAAARERLAKQQAHANSQSQSATLRERPSLKRLRVHSPDMATDAPHMAASSASTRSAATVRSTSASNGAAAVVSTQRAALGPASSSATNGQARPGSAAAGMMNGSAHVPRFAMSTAASAAKSVSTAPTSKGLPTVNVAPAAISSRPYAAHAHGASNRAPYSRGGGLTMTSAAPMSAASTAASSHAPPLMRLHSGRNMHRRRSSLGETDIIM